MRNSFFIALFTIAAVSFAPRTAHAEVNRCRASDGTLVFTDQSCDLLGTAYKLSAAYQPGTDVRRPGKPWAGRPMPHFGIGCAARSPEGLRLAVRMAIDSGDVNELSALIDWNGASRRYAMDLVRRLQNIVSRPIVAVELGGEVFDYGSQPTVTAMSASYGAGEAGSRASVGTDANDTYVVATRGLPSLHILRAHGETSPIEHTRFAIVRDSGCLWLRP